MTPDGSPSPGPHVERPAPEPQGHPTPPLHALGTAAVATLAGFLLARPWRFGPVDDAYITLRYAANWGRGAGLVFNPGEVVEGFSTFLLVALQAGLVGLGADPVVAMEGLGWASLGLLAAVTFAFLRTHLVPGRSPEAAALTLALVLNPMVVAWASSGMEPCLYGALVLWTLHLALGHGGARRPALVGLALALTAMTRLEALALVPVMLAVAWARARDGRAAARALAVFAAAFGVYFFARAHHFGALFPNTFYAKVDYGNGELWRRGALYAWDFLRSVPLLALGALAALAAAVRAGPLWLRGTLALLAFQFLTVVYVGGDHFAFFRFLVPAFVPLAAAALAPLFRLPARRGRDGRGARALPAALALLVLALTGARAGAVHRRGEGIPDAVERRQEEAHTQRSRYVYEAELAATWSDIGRALKAFAPADATLCVITIGAIGYYSELPILDPYGLTEPAIGRQARPLGEGYAGHEKYDVDYVLSRRPDLVLLVNALTDAPVPEERLETAVWGAFNRAILRRPGFRDGYRYASLPVDGRFLNLHFHADRVGGAGAPP